MMSKQLMDCKWKEFRIGDIFEVYTGSLLPKKELRSGKIPRITASETNNGVVGTFATSSHKNFRQLSNFISISFLGGVFYQPYLASLDMKIHAVKIKGKYLTKYTAHFLVTALHKTVAGFSYGDQLSSTDLPSKKILLPIDKNDQPDWQFMEDYMKQKKKVLIGEYKRYLTVAPPPPLEKIDRPPKWKEFVLSYIFEIKATSSSIDKSKLNGKSGKIPYITRTDKDNGYDGFIGKQEKYSFDNGNVISVGLDTQTAFYQPIAFYTGQNIQVVSNKYLNRYAAMFVILLLKRLMTKFSWGGNGATLTRLKRSKILLPVAKSGEPDYEYMTNYMRRLERKQLKCYVDYLTS
ncbi:MAG: restriction endonuclease subunit S [Candidatus Margulisbacteria bacterium]|jgi:hypothetical protein|nr:restriction endonuclease subunit S [Candidatus Margulisiibacteriota bacterium]